MYYDRGEKERILVTGGKLLMLVIILNLIFLNSKYKMKYIKYECHYMKGTRFVLMLVLL